MAERDNSRGPDLGAMNLGALAGAVVGSIGGLFGVGIPHAIVLHSLQAMFSTPKLAVICFVISGGIGFILGWLFGRPIGRRFGNPWAELAVGVAGGLLPVIAVLWWSYYMVTSP